MLIGFGIASASMGGMKGLFTELGKTQDWVLEYRNLISGGALFVAFILWAVFVLITRPNEQKAGGERS